MKLYNDFLLTSAKVIRFSKSPRVIKYLLYLFVKGRRISTKGEIRETGKIVYLDIGNFIDYWVFMEGYYEGEWLKYIKGLNLGGTFLDIGAHIGIHSLFLSSKFDKIYAFEPERKNFAKLKNHIKLNSIKNVISVKCALSDYKGFARLYTHKTENCGHSLLINYHAKFQRVRIDTLDNFVRQKRVKDIKLIKIDVEGSEINVLRGSRKVIDKFHPLIFLELNKPVLENIGSSVQEIYSFLSSRCYNCFRLVRGRLRKLGSTALDKVYYENVLFVYKKE